MQIKYHSFTDRGLQRKENEDSVYAYKKDNCAVFIVADGMGGCENGKKASDIIVRYVAKYIEIDLDKVKEAKKSFGMIYDSNIFFMDIIKCLENANKDIYLNYTSKGHNSGTTLVMLAIYDNNYTIFWAGDSHIYQIIDSELVALTVDDVWENDKNRIEGLTIEQIKNNQNYGRLTNAFGTIENVKIHTTNGILNCGMSFFLCSDGIYKYCDITEFTNVLLDNKLNEKEIIEKIKAKVYKNGAPDNLSYVFIENLE